MPHSPQLGQYQKNYKFKYSNLFTLFTCNDNWLHSNLKVSFKTLLLILCLASHQWFFSIAIVYICYTFALLPLSQTCIYQLCVDLQKIKNCLNICTYSIMQSQIPSIDYIFHNILWLWWHFGFLVVFFLFPFHL